MRINAMETSVSENCGQNAGLRTKPKISLQ